MNRSSIQACAALFVTACVVTGCSKEAPRNTASPAPPREAPVTQPQSGEALFRQFCSSCHPDGGNVSDPARTLHGEALRRNNISTADDVVRIMRNPGARMIRFDVTTVPDRDAHAIADYVLKTFR